jgi:hypothetical protein
MIVKNPPGVRTSITLKRRVWIDDGYNGLGGGSDTLVHYDQMPIPPGQNLMQN